jgi:hypothetical protein
MADWLVLVIVVFIAATVIITAGNVATITRPHRRRRARESEDSDD